MRWNQFAALVILLPTILALSAPSMLAAPGSSGASTPMSARDATTLGRTVLAAASLNAATGATSRTVDEALAVPAGGVPARAHKSGIAAAGSVWRRVIYDKFNGTKVPSHWFKYNGPYGSGPKNCARPSHVYVTAGQLRLLMKYESSGNCGAGWYTGGLMINQEFGGVDQRITLKFKVVRKGAAGHLVIPMRWPDSVPWPQGGEEDFCETDDLKGCSTFLHYSSSNKQIDRRHTVNLANYHTIRFQRYNHVVKVFIDNMTTPRWTYSGSSATLPDTFKRVVLQQECQRSCPSGKRGYESIRIAWITIDTAN